MNFQPLADRLLVRRIEEQETVRGGIIIPDTAKEKPQEGEVVAVGPGKLTDEGTEYVILREDEVLGVLSKTSSK
jgi:chaperonin GroES